MSMSDAQAHHLPIHIERVETERLERDTVIVRLKGRWRGNARVHEGRELLVVQLDDRRQRFPAMPDERRAAIATPGAWSARFMLPDWSKPGPGWEASLLIGDAVIPVPGSKHAVEPAEPEPGRLLAPEPGSLSAPGPPSEPEFGVGPAEDPRAGPLSKLLLRDTVAALHAELEQRAAAAAQLRGRLADTHAELEARVNSHAHLETTHGELRRELDALGELVRQDGARREKLEAELTDARGRVADLERELAGAAAAGEQRASDSASLRDQLNQTTSAYDRLAAETADLRDELATARATSEREAAAGTRTQAREHELSTAIARLRAELAGANVARDSARSESTGLRTELDRLGTELATLREQAGSQSGELGEAKALLSDARALSAMLRERQHGKGPEAV
jgi:uncharacterized coiled-coil DUF342 family protein